MDPQPHSTARCPAVQHVGRGPGDNDWHHQLNSFLHSEAVEMFLNVALIADLITVIVALSFEV